MSQFEFSRIGQKLTGRSGILELMDDLGRALTTQPQMRMLGGGNPAANLLENPQASASLASFLDMNRTCPQNKKRSSD